MIERGKTRIAQGLEGGTSASADGGARNPFIERAYLEAARLHGPGHGQAVLIETRERDRARWGVVERSRFGMRGAVAFAGASFAPDADRRACWSELLDQLAARRNVVARFGSISSVRIPAGEIEMMKILARDRRWGISETRYGTYVVDLSRGESEIFDGIHSSCRRGIKFGDKGGLKLERMTGDGSVDEYMALSDATFARYGLAGPPRPYVEALYAIPSLFRFYAARGPDGVAHSVAIIACSDTGSFYLHGGSGSRSARGAGNWIHWEMMRDLAKDGSASYDLGGVDLDDRFPQSRGIREFKGSFGGVLERYTTVDIVFAPLRFRAVQFALDVVNKRGRRPREDAGG